MKYVNVVLVFLFLVSCSSNKSGIEPPSWFGEVNSDEGTLIGYGAASRLDAAMDAARADILLQLSAVLQARITRISGSVNGEVSQASRATLDVASDQIALPMLSASRHHHAGAQHYVRIDAAKSQLIDGLQHQINKLNSVASAPTANALPFFDLVNSYRDPGLKQILSLQQVLFLLSESEQHRQAYQATQARLDALNAQVDALCFESHSDSAAFNEILISKFREVGVNISIQPASAACMQAQTKVSHVFSSKAGNKQCDVELMVRVSTPEGTTSVKKAKGIGVSQHSYKEAKLMAVDVAMQRIVTQTY